jgi:chromosome segregation ATPase
MALTIDGLTSWRSEADSRISSTDSSTQAALARIQQLGASTEMLREQANDLAAQTTTLLNDKTEMALTIDGLTSWRSEADSRISSTDSSARVAADTIEQLRNAIDAIRHQATALESEMRTAVHGVIENHDLKLREIATKQKQDWTDYERQLAENEVHLKALETHVNSSAHAEQLQTLSRDVADLAQLVNEAELGLVGDIAKIVGQTSDHAELLASIKATVGNLDTRVKDATAVSTEFSAIVARVDSKANSLSHAQSELLERIEAVAATVAAKAMQADSMPLDAHGRTQPAAPKPSKQGKTAPAKKLRISKSNAERTSRPAATKARKTTLSARNRR